MNNLNLFIAIAACVVVGVMSECSDYEKKMKCNRDDECMWMDDDSTCMSFMCDTLEKKACKKNKKVCAWMGDDGCTLKPTAPPTEGTACTVLEKKTVCKNSEANCVWKRRKCLDFSCDSLNKKKCKKNDLCELDEEDNCIAFVPTDPPTEAPFDCTSIPSKNGCNNRADSKAAGCKWTNKRKCH